MVSKLTICCLILLTLSGLTWSSTNSNKRVANLQKTLRKNNHLIMKIIPKKMNENQKRRARTALSTYVKSWNEEKQVLKRSGKGKISKKQMKDLETEFDKTVSTVERMLDGGKGQKRFSLSPVTLMKSSIDVFQNGIDSILNLCNRIGEKIINTMIKVLEGCNKASVKFLKGLKNIFKMKGGTGGTGEDTIDDGWDDTPDEADAGNGDGADAGGAGGDLAPDAEGGGE